MSLTVQGEASRPLRWRRWVSWTVDGSRVGTALRCRAVWWGHILGRAQSGGSPQESCGSAARETLRACTIQEAECAGPALYPDLTGMGG
jgi:hypothetical protein